VSTSSWWGFELRDRVDLRLDRFSVEQLLDQHAKRVSRGISEEGQSQVESTAIRNTEYDDDEKATGRARGAKGSHRQRAAARSGTQTVWWRGPLKV
jgi:hypothetical protein